MTKYITIATILTSIPPPIPDELNTFNRINRNAFKPPVSEAVKQIVRANFTREIEFYEFCRQRLHLQLRALRDPTVTIPTIRSARKRRAQRRFGRLQL